MAISSGSRRDDMAPRRAPPIQENKPTGNGREALRDLGIPDSRSTNHHPRSYNALSARVASNGPAFITRDLSMGIQDRDYYRDDVRRFSGGRSVVATIIGINVVVYVLQVLTDNSPNSVSHWLDLDLFPLLQGQVWRLVTYAFCHDVYNILHILINMLVLWWFGREIEAILGPREFTTFYLVSAIAAGILYLVIGFLLGGDIAPMVGASGAGMAVLVVFAMYFPRQKVYLYFLFPIEIRWLIAAYVVFELYPVLMQFGGQPAGDHVAHAAHLGGLGFGFLYKWNGWRLTSFLPRKGSKPWAPGLQTRPQVRIFRGGEESADSNPKFTSGSKELDREVDRILTKIHEQGEASLTQEERETLVRASEQYKRKQ
jgi:membrane associated rhomboid family serine protease